MADTETNPVVPFWDLEGAICDLAIMARLAEATVESVLHDTAALSGEVHTEQRELIEFSMKHVTDMARKLEADFYAAWERSKADASA